MRRIMVFRQNALIYLANPDCQDARDSGGVGFPASDVFRFDEALYRRLREQWETKGATDQETWAEATPCVTSTGLSAAR